MHRHPSNNLVLYTTTNIQADTLRICSKDWIPLLSYKLQLHNPVHVVVIHASQCPSALLTPNTWPCLQKWTQILNPAPCFVKWTSSNAVQLGESHSLIRIGFVNSDQEKTTVKQKQFYRIFNKKIEFSQKIKPHFMNCPQEDHITRYFKAKFMCLYCAKEHTTDKCVMHGKIMTNCTACLRHLKKSASTIDIKALFSETPRHLRHSPIDPTYP